MIRTKQVNAEIFRESYFSLIEKFYPNNLETEYYISDLLKGLNYSIESNELETCFFCSYSNKELAGCISLIVDSRLESNTCMFGFFECIEDTNVFNSLWFTLSNKAKELEFSQLNGPINGSIWHQYRVVSKQFSNIIFPSEPYSQTFYYGFLKSVNPSKEIEYHSACRKNFDVIINHTEESYRKVLEKDITIENALNFDMDLLKVLFEFSKHIFAKSWSYVPLSFTEFAELYNTSKISNFVGSVYLAKKQDKIIGFCMNIETPDFLIMKTIGVIPEYQKLGIGNALVHKVHSDARKKGIKQVIYALINKMNKIQHFPTEEVIMLRDYAGFEFSLSTNKK